MTRDEVIAEEQPTLGFPYPWWRNTDRTKIHRAGCRHAVAPFTTAADWSDNRMRHFIATVWHVSACKVCARDLT